MRNMLLVAFTATLALASGSCWDAGGGDVGPPPQSTIEPAASADALDGATVVADDLGVSAIALNADALEEFPVAVFWAGEAEDEGPTVQSGFWYLVVRDEEGVRRSPDAIASSGSEPLSLDAADETIPGDEGEAGAAFEALARFVLANHASYLASLQVLTGGFESAPFDPEAETSGDDAEQLLLLIGELEGGRSAAGTAVDILGRQRLVASAAGPAFGLFDGLKEKIQDPIKAQDAAKTARQDLALAFGRMTIPEQQEAFRRLTRERGLDIDAGDAATFIEHLDDGDYDNIAAQARNFLQNDADYFGYFDLRNIQTARQEGAKLVINGSEYYVSAVKEVLAKQFPGIEKGWEAIEDLEQKLQRLLNPEIKPSDVAALLRELGYEFTDEEAESLVQTMKYSIELLKEQAVSRAQPAPTPLGQATDGNWAVYDMARIEEMRNGKLGLLVSAVDKVNKIRICTLEGGGLCEGANANTTLAEAGGVVMVLGPFETEEDAVRAYCDNIVPGTVRETTFFGTLADMKFDGQTHAIFNAPGCGG